MMSACFTYEERPVHSSTHRNISKMAIQNTLITNKAYVDGEWVGADSGATFDVTSESSFTAPLIYRPRYWRCHSLCARPARN